MSARPDPGLLLPALLLLALCAASLAWGAAPPWTAEGAALWDLRAGRLATGLGAGAALGLSGAICQGLLRNPLAAPDMIGITAGAALGGAGMLLGFGAGGALLSLGAAGGGLAAGALALALARQGGRHGGRIAPARLILAGVGIALSAQAWTGVLLSAASDGAAGEATLWLTGSLNGRGRPEAAALWAALIAAGAPAFALARALDRLRLGEEVALSLGIRVEPCRAALAGAAVLLASAAVAAAGPMAFVALAAGPLSRAMGGPGLIARPMASLLAAALTGAAIVTGADLATRAFAPVAYTPAGLWTGALGAPVLIWMLRRAARRHGEGRA